MITLLNQDRLDAGKGTLGFVNPLLYSLWEEDPSCFWDITVGLNDDGCMGDGFSAAKGWDPLTGLGTVRFDKVRQYVMSLP